MGSVYMFKKHDKMLSETVSVWLLGNDNRKRKIWCFVCISQIRRKRCRIRSQCDFIENSQNNLPSDHDLIANQHQTTFMVSDSFLNCASDWDRSQIEEQI
jgi:hypothetical protein